MIGSTTNVDVEMRLRVSGSDNSSAEYRRQRVYGSGATAGADRRTGDTAWLGVWAVQNTYRPATQFIISNPFSTLRTTATNNNSANLDANIDIVTAGFSNDAVTSYTGYTILVASGTFSGSVSTYGFNK